MYELLKKNWKGI